VPVLTLVTLLRVRHCARRCFHSVCLLCTYFAPGHALCLMLPPVPSPFCVCPPPPVLHTTQPAPKPTPKPPPSYTKSQWEAKLADVDVDRAALNKLVMDYLVIEGYKEAAEALSAEAGVEPGVELSTITERMCTRQSIQEGDVAGAMARAVALDADILTRNPALFFHLQQQQLIELIRSGDATSALSFATAQLAPTGSSHPAHLGELEATLALLAFDTPADADKCPMAALLSPSQRQKTASELNAAILASQNQETMPRLPGLLRSVLWAEKQLEERAKFPHMSVMDAELGAPSGATSAPST